MSDAAGELDCVIAADTLTQWLDTLDAIVDEVRIRVGPDGWDAFPRDPANVAMVKQSLADTAFEAYYAESFTFGANIESLRDYATAGNADVVSLEYDSETRKVHIQNGRASFDMALIDPDSIRADGEISDGVADGFDGDVTLDGAALAHGFDIAGMVSDHVSLAGDPDADAPVTIGAEGDTDDAAVDFEDSLHEGSTVDKECESLFSHDYLENLAKPIPNDAAVRLRFGDEWPLMLEYEHSDGGADVTAMCAPRIQSK
jgi:proliferating cell nuclear antigen